MIAGEALPPGCMGGATGLTVNVPLIAGGTTPVAVPCGFASDNGEAPNDQDTHNVWNNSGSDGSFGITSPIFLENITTEGSLLGTLPIPSDQIVTSFSSKSELAVNLATDGKSITFMRRTAAGWDAAARTFVTGPNQLDVSNSNTPGVVRSDESGDLELAKYAEYPHILLSSSGGSGCGRASHALPKGMHTAETMGGRRSRRIRCTT